MEEIKRARFMGGGPGFHALGTNTLATCPHVYQKKLSRGEEKEGGDIRIPMTYSCWWMAETNTILKSNYPSIKNKCVNKQEKKERNSPYLSFWVLWRLHLQAWLINHWPLVTELNLPPLPTSHGFPWQPAPPAFGYLTAFQKSPHWHNKRHLSHSQLLRNPTCYSAVWKNEAVPPAATETVSGVPAQSCLTLGDPMACSPPGCSVHGILQARILEWGAIFSSRGSSQPRDRTLSIQEKWVQSLVREDPTGRGATKPMHHNCWACALEPGNHNYWSSLSPEPALHNKRNSRKEKPAQHNERVPH